jgi:HlyD family secretion protein
MRTVFVILVVIGAAASGAVYYARHVPADSVAGFRTVAIKRGDLLSTISATGTVEPEEVVDVGAQVMGLILEFGPDPRDPAKSIDYCSIVEKDAVLAKIDPIPYEAALDQAEATLERSEADLLQLEAKCEQAERDYDRAKRLRPDRAASENKAVSESRTASENRASLDYRAMSDSDYDTAFANFKAARANVAVGKAAIRQSKAALRVANINLGYTTIKSPVRGVIIDRRVNIGQTVVASLNAPSLFLIAKDLRRMQVWASVNEADIGRIHVDMPVQFTVDAHQGQTFLGKVTQIRMNATMTQNVVTYTVIVTTDNSSGKLLPYLTANVQFEADKRSNVLLAPNAALRWKPQASQMDPAAGKTGPTPAETADAQDRGWLWVETGQGLVRPLEVVVGTSDGTMTEISGGGVKDGVQVVVGEEGSEDQEGEEAAHGEKTSNPFLPKPPKGSRPPPGPPM